MVRALFTRLRRGTCALEGAVDDGSLRTSVDAMRGTNGGAMVFGQKGVFACIHACVRVRACV